MTVDASITSQLRALAAGSQNEVCGALIGDAAGIAALVPLHNRSVHSEVSYLISARDVLHAEEAAARFGFSVIGFYHSHPRGTVRPSHSDLEQAVPGYTYLIVAPDGAMRAWRLRADRSDFDEVSL